MNTPEIVSHLLPNEIFVFGSNYAGMHGAGAAYDAVRRFGARNGIGQGLCGNSYGIATKGHSLEVLPINRIQAGVERFAREAEAMRQLRFLVTPIGCGLAGYAPRDIAPLFRGVVDFGNVILPKCFTDILIP